MVRLSPRIVMTAPKMPSVRASTLAFPSPATEPPRALMSLGAIVTVGYKFGRIPALFAGGDQNLPRAPPPPVRPPPKPPRRYRLSNAPIQRNERPRVKMETARKTTTTIASAFQWSTRREGSRLADPPSYFETISLPTT